MKHTVKNAVIRRIAIIALVALIGFSFASCDNGAGGSGGGAPSKLLITGLPASGDYVVYVFPSGHNISTVMAITMGIAGSQVAAGTNSSGNLFDMYNYPGGGSFTVTGSRPVVLQNLNTDDPYGTANPMFRRGAVSFVNGGATVSYSSFTVVTGFF